MTAPVLPKLPLATGGKLWIPEKSLQTRIDNFSLGLYLVAVGFIIIGFYSWFYYKPSTVTAENTFLPSESSSAFFAAFTLASSVILFTVLRAFFTGRVRSIKTLWLHATAFLVSVICSSLSLFGPSIVAFNEAEIFDNWATSALQLPEGSVIVSGLDSGVAVESRSTEITNGQVFSAQTPDGIIVFSTELQPDGSFSLNKVSASEGEPSSSETEPSPTASP